MDHLRYSGLPFERQRDVLIDIVRGEPIVCTPGDALDMFFGSDLRYLAMEDFLVTKRDA